MSRANPLRRWAHALLFLGPTIALVAVSTQTGRAVPGGSYRPVIPSAALAGACNPLPPEIELIFDHQLRADRMITDPGGREIRRLDLHFDLTDAANVLRALELTLFEAGFVGVPPPSGADPAVTQWFEREDYGLLGVAAADFVGVEDHVVRGSWLVDLPADTLTPEMRAACDNPVQTKRW